MVRRRARPSDRSAMNRSVGEVSEVTVKAMRVSSLLNRTPPRSPAGAPLRRTVWPERVSSTVSSVEASAFRAETR
ncbi:hypothetical protein D3C80_1094970 [compost metagenome]